MSHNECRRWFSILHLLQCEQGGKRDGGQFSWMRGLSAVYQASQRWVEEGNDPSCWFCWVHDSRHKVVNCRPFLDEEARCSMGRIWGSDETSPNIVFNKCLEGPQFWWREWVHASRRRFCTFFQVDFEVIWMMHGERWTRINKGVHGFRIRKCEGNEKRVWI